MPKSKQPSAGAPIAGDPVIAWRARRLRAAGLPPGRATAIAADLRYDLHALLELMDHDCPIELAVRIVAPLDVEEHAR
jgi:hypothetical protein